LSVVRTRGSFGVTPFAGRSAMPAIDLREIGVVLRDELRAAERDERYAARGGRDRRHDWPFRTERGPAMLPAPRPAPRLLLPPPAAQRGAGDRDTGGALRGVRALLGRLFGVRAELTPFQRCLAVHMALARPRGGLS